MYFSCAFLLNTQYTKGYGIIGIVDAVLLISYHISAPFFVKAETAPSLFLLQGIAFFNATVLSIFFKNAANGY
jgi:hypothetical protein